jgi:hypothetical protein
MKKGKIFTKHNPDYLIKGYSRSKAISDEKR